MKLLTTIAGVEIDNDVFTSPTDRLFRDAWYTDNPNSTIEVDMVSAREFWRGLIRQERTQHLLDLDAQFMKALETGADTTSIVLAKQAYRDAPNHPDIDAATTPEELRLVKPEGLTLR